MPGKETKNKSPFLLRLRNYFTTGLLVLAPTALSIWIIQRLFVIFDGILGKFYARYLFEPLGKKSLPGLGALTLVIVIIIIGMSVRHYAGRKIFEIWERAINYIPLVNRVYLAIRQLADAFGKGGGILFERAVIVEYPRKGIYSVGFVTNHCSGPFCDRLGKSASCVFIPTTPNPTSGMVVIVPDDDLITLAISIEDAMKLIMSAGTVFPEISSLIDRSD
ncbi:DUF502 domain-containing protein [bacterium]|nr:DUF502 domain-containing protein [bacterium]